MEDTDQRIEKEPVEEKLTQEVTKLEARNGTTPVIVDLKVHSDYYGTVNLVETDDQVSN